MKPEETKTPPVRAGGASSSIKFNTFSNNKNTIRNQDKTKFLLDKTAYAIIDFEMRSGARIFFIEVAHRVGLIRVAEFSSYAAALTAAECLMKKGYALRDAYSTGGLFS